MQNQGEINVGILGSYSREKIALGCNAAAYFYWQKDIFQGETTIFAPCVRVTEPKPSFKVTGSYENDWQSTYVCR